ncbi:MAG: DUF928 domain-containing protein [Pleurocapsa sp. SU_5_0]|nr:DUF928 domain-containing protein [Pleurocapsa sp. SU_5_0]NJO95467.1 DUF928 domain-containing protein [Pleurocapsa sp. CRU_1_2]NJR47800.1 DUF928 domain-containing protein [Hyellaceae cyanobacterium CSU_1_1]
MPNTLYNLYRFKHSYSLAICLWCLSLGMTHPAQAEYKKPPTPTGNDAPDAQTTSIAATRGVCNPAADRSEQKANSATLTALAPYSHVGQSSSTHPTFTWYLPDQESYPMEFWLYEFDPTSYDGKGKQVYQAKLSSSAGIMTHALSKEQASLSPGKTYVWQVAVICNPNSPSQSLVVNNRVKIVPVDPTITTQLNNSSDGDYPKGLAYPKVYPLGSRRAPRTLTDRLKRSDIYAQAGLWYDALAEVATMPNDPQAQNLTLKLISQLAATEQAKNSPSAENTKEIKLIETHQQNLQRIIETLQP